MPGNVHPPRDRADLLFYLSALGDENVACLPPTPPDRVARRVLTATDVRDHLALRRARSAIVLGDRRRLTAQFIIDIERHMSSAGAVWGLWCQPQSWPVLEAPGDGANVARPDLVIDVPEGTAWSHDRGWRPLGDVRQALRRPTGICALIAHGDGSHLDLGEAILCGLADDGETVGGRPVDGGCTRSSCKKQAGHAGYLLHADDLNANLLVILSCNSMSLASELYPSSLSLALSAANVQATPVIGTVSQLPFSSETGVDIVRHIRTAVNVGTSVAALNARWKDAGIPCAYVLLGDPLTSFARRQEKARSRAEVPGSDRHQVSLADARSAWRLRNTLDSVTRAATSAALQHRSLPQQLQHNVRAMAHAQALVDSRVWQMQGPSAIGDGESLLEMTRARRPGGPALEEIKDALGDWGKALLELTPVVLLSGPPGLPVFGDKLAEVLGRHLVIEEHGKGDPCPRCGTPVIAYRLDNRVLPVHPRRRSVCLVCGPVADQVDGALKVEVHPPTYSPRKDQGVDLDVQVTAQREMLGLTGCPVHLLVEVRDKSVPDPVYCKLLTLRSTAMSVRHIEVVPLGKGADLHSVRVIAARCGLVASARCLLSPIPVC
jgi:hypothetical protein